jgi:hypothetical protein
MRDRGLTLPPLALPVRPIVTLVTVVFPLKGLEVCEVVRATFGDRLHVVDLPTVIRSLTVRSPRDPGSTAVLPELG